MNVMQKIGRLSGSVAVDDPAECFPDNFTASLIEDHVAKFSPTLGGVDDCEDFESRMRVLDAVVAQQRAVFFARNGHLFGVVTTASAMGEEFRRSSFATSAFAPLF